MKKYLVFIVFCLLSVSTWAQTPTPTPTPQQPRQDPLDIATYGVQFETDQRLIVIMAALEAAGFDPTPKNREPSAFRALVRRDLQDLDADLRARLRKFFTDHNRELDAEFAKTNPTYSERVARYAERYISLAYALGVPPVFEMPPRSDDLPGSVLELLDFTPLLREFYRKARMDERLPEYVRAYRKTGDDMRPAMTDMVRGVLSYLHTIPLTRGLENIQVKSPGTQKKNAPTRTVIREYDRRFIIVPDLLAVPGAINLRVIADDYYVIVPPGITPSSSELRRAYLQYVVDPLVIRFNKEVAARREEVKKLLEERRAGGRSITPDIFLAVARSLIIAAEVRMNEIPRVNAMVNQINREPDAAKRKELITKLREVQNTLSDEGVLQLSEAYESGAVLAFYFAEQLKGLEASGFDVAAMMPDMIATFDAARESKRLTENDAARQRAAFARAQRDKAVANAPAPEALTGRALMLKKLESIEQLLNQQNYAAAEEQLKELLTEFPGEPRIFFALGRAASGAAQGAFDEVKEQRLNIALGQYRLAIEKAAPDTEQWLISRANYLMGRIYEHFDNNEEALKAYAAAIKPCPANGVIPGGACLEARQSKAALAKQP